MDNPYRELFSTPGTVAFSVASLVARISLPMTGIGIITMLSQLRGMKGHTCPEIAIINIIFIETTLTFSIDFTKGNPLLIFIFFIQLFFIKFTQFFGKKHSLKDRIRF